MPWTDSRPKLTYTPCHFFSNRLNQVKVTWRKKSPLEKWLIFVQFMKFLGSKCLQLHSLFEHKPIGPIAYIPGFFCVVNCIFLIYTTCYYILVGNFNGCLPSYGLLGLIISVSKVHIEYEIV